MLRIRSGHSKLAMDDKTSQEEKCRCGEYETVEHVRAVSCKIVGQR